MFFNATMLIQDTLLPMYRVKEFPPLFIWLLNEHVLILEPKQLLNPLIVWPTLMSFCAIIISPACLCPCFIVEATIIYIKSRLPTAVISYQLKLGLAERPKRSRAAMASYFASFRGLNITELKSYQKLASTFLVSRMALQKLLMLNAKLLAEVVWHNIQKQYRT